MRRRVSSWLLLALIGCSGDAADAECPVALSDADLATAGVGYGSDSSAVIAALGPPVLRGSGVWSYPSLTLWLDGAAVHQIALIDSERRTARGLRVGDAEARVTKLYGRSCYQGAYAFCRTVGAEPDERGMLVEVADGRVAEIRLGAVFDLD